MTQTLFEKREMGRHRRQGFEAAMPANAARKRLLLSVAAMDLRYFLHPDFDTPEKGESLFSGGSSFDLGTISAAWNAALASVKYDSLPDHKRVILTSAEERRLFLQFNYARLRFSMLIDVAQARRFTPAEMREARKWATRLKRVKDSLVVANLALVFAMGRQCGVFSTELSNDVGDILYEGFTALMRAVDRFDVGRGYKFSTYGCRAIIQSMTRHKARLYSRMRWENNAPVEHFAESPGPTPDFEPDQIEDLRQALENNFANLDDNEKIVIEQRYFLSRKLEDVGNDPRLGVTKERVRQIQNKAIGKLRGFLVPA